MTSWLRYIDDHGEPWRGSQPGYHPLGNWTELVEERNVAGDAVAVFRRSVFDNGLAYSPELTSFEDWALYREMHELGLIGTVIPERLWITGFGKDRCCARSARRTRSASNARSGPRSERR